MKWLLTLSIVLCMSAESSADLRSSFGRAVERARRQSYSPPRIIEYSSPRSNRAYLYRYWRTKGGDGVIDLDHHRVIDAPIQTDVPLTSSGRRSPYTRYRYYNTPSPSRSTYSGMDQSQREVRQLFRELGID